MNSDPGYDKSPEVGLGVWGRALRAPFLTASLVPVLVGASAAYWNTGHFSIKRLVLALGGVACLHLGANLANDFFDEITGCDRLNPEPTPFSGGSRVIQEGLLSSSQILAASVVFLALGALLGLVLNAMVPGNAILVIGVVGLVCGILYTAVPAKLSYRGVGEILVFLAFGPLIVAGTYLSQVGRVEAFPFLVSVPLGLLVMCILLVNEVLDIEWDRLAGKRTLVVMLGERRGYLLFFSAYIVAYLWVVVGLLAGIYQVWAALALLPLVVFVRALLPARALHTRAAKINASRVTIMSHTIAGCLLALSFLL